MGVLRSGRNPINKKKVGVCDRNGPMQSAQHFYRLDAVCQCQTSVVAPRTGWTATERRLLFSLDLLCRFMAGLRPAEHGTTCREARHRFSVTCTALFADSVSSSE